MSNPFRNLAQQLYLSIAPIGISGVFLVHGLRRNEKYSSLYTWRSDEKVPDSVVDDFDTEFTEMITKSKKKFKDAKFSVSLIDNLEARTYGSFRIIPGVEFQVPVISTVNDVKTLKSKYPNLLELVKELGLKGSVDTTSIPDDKLKRVLLTDRAKNFFLRREITQGESLSHMVIPMGVGSACIFLGFPVFKVFALGMGPWIALIVTSTVALISAFHLLEAEAKQRTLAMDHRILEEDKSLIAGAKEYLRARIAFGRLAYEYGDDPAKKGFDDQGNCQGQYASYVERLKEVVKFEEQEALKEQTAKIRSLEQISFKEQADAWIRSNWGRRFRIGLLAGTVAIYPVYHLIASGPLLKYFFYKKHEIDTDLPPHLKNIIEEVEHQKFCERELRLPKDAIVHFGIQKGLESVDSIAKGSLGVRFGAHVALPFYARFTSKEEALDYCKKNLPELKLFGKSIPINWDTPTGQELLSTFVLPTMALRFLVMRDMYANDGYNAYANRAISWATWTSFTSIFTYWFHQKTRTCNGTALSFAIVYGIFLLLAIFAHDQWFLLYRFLADTHGDSVASRITMDYSTGGKEYYWNILKRNRILRDFIPNGYEYITPVGDFRDVTTKLIVRYDLLKDVGIEDDEIRPIVEGDD